MCCAPTAVQRRLAAILAAAVTLAAGCTGQRPGVAAADDGCTFCHGDPASFPGDPLRSAAPPQGLHLADEPGATSTDAPGVGAHQAHLREGALTRTLDCTECHVVPRVDGLLYSSAPGHLGATLTEADSTPGRAELVFDGRAVLGGVAAGYDYGTYGCTTYCHGVTLAGGTTTRPTWNLVGQGQAECGSCHGLPPDKPGHPRSAHCSKCHPTVDADMAIIDKDRHIDGTIDLADNLCNGCHGSAQNPAPPVDTLDRSETTLVSVGAHQAHLNEGPIALAFACSECHVVPDPADLMAHIDGVAEVTFGTLARADGAAPAWSGTTCNTYCHGQTLSGGTLTTPQWTLVDGSQAACGTCHGLPPQSAGHPQNDRCHLCHPTVDANRAIIDKALHVNGVVDLRQDLTCTSCHGDATTNNPAPPVGTNGETLTTQAAVGAHAAHLTASTWHRSGKCVDCHAVPSSVGHANGQVDFVWGAPSNVSGANPAYNGGGGTCTSVYCHGTTLLGPNNGGTVNREPSWTTVDGTFNACGTTCHTNPPGGGHPQSTACASCHGAVIASYTPGKPPTATWADPQRHIDGTVDVSGGTCTSCHGDSATNNPAPPLGTNGETLTTQAAVGAHQQHLGTSTWHRNGQCVDCHVVPATTLHSNGVVDFAWSLPSNADGANPAYVTANATCTNVYCHGTTLMGPVSGGTVNRTPVWTTVNGTYDACGTTCHTLPPGGSHPASTACQTCHSPVVATFTPGTPPTVTWANAQLHIDGKVDTVGLTCTACHGTAGVNPAPPRGVGGETQTTDPAVGAHQQHLGASTWHRDVQCTDCHPLPASTAHSNSTTDFAWSTVATGSGAVTPVYSTSTHDCTNVYCHGVTLQGPRSGGTISRTPVWTTVNGTYDACGSTCHTNPPGGTHVTHTDCTICHAAVVATFDPATNATTWADRTRHVDGTIDRNNYHDLANWTAPKGNANHHGSNYFLTNQQRDEHNRACTSCHGANLDGGSVNVSCNNATCHGGDWRRCTFCHGNDVTGDRNPPLGVGGETATSTLAVGRHTAHLTASATHVAFTCDTCHTVPTVGDVAHAAGYVPSTSLATAGHHGDVTLSGRAAGMTWDVNGTQGSPVSARGTCLGACHSDGSGGTPAVTPYWSGGSWTAGSCGSCHSDSPTTADHQRHISRFGGSASCVVCHPAADSASHLNGQKDVNATISDPGGSGGVTVSRPTTGTCANTVRCDGTCHFHVHNPACW